MLLDDVDCCFDGCLITGLSRLVDQTVQMLKYAQPLLSLSQQRCIELISHDSPLLQSMFDASHISLSDRLSQCSDQLTAFLPFGNDFIKNCDFRHQEHILLDHGGMSQLATHDLII